MQIKTSFSKLTTYIVIFQTYP